LHRKRIDKPFTDRKGETMRCSQRLASTVALVFVGALFMAAGCKQDSPSGPAGEKSSAYQEVTVEVSGMT
jgi:hypothetical protein